MTPALANIIPDGADVFQVVISAGSRMFTHLDDMSVMVLLPAPGATPASVAHVSRAGLRTRLVPVASHFEGGFVSFETSLLGLFVVGR